MKTLGRLQIPSSLEDLADPSRTALLVYDMQVGILQQIRDAERITETCARLLACARSHGMRIAYTRHLSPPRAWMGGSQYRTAMSWQKATDPSQVKLPFQRNAPPTQIVPALGPADDDLVVDKYAMSGFAGTALEFFMRDAGLKALAICGIALDIGVEPTVRHATDLGVIPIVITDACGAGNADAGARTLDTMRFVGEAILTDAQTFMSRLQSAS